MLRSGWGRPNERVGSRTVAGSRLGRDELMTNVGQAATAELVSAAAAPAPGWLPRALGLGAVALALLSALVTFVVLAGLTPIPPTHEVVVSLLAANAFTVFLLVLVIAREVWGVVQARRRGRGPRVSTCVSLPCSPSSPRCPLFSSP